MRVLRGRRASWASLAALVALAGGAAFGSALSTSTWTTSSALQTTTLTQGCGQPLRSTPLLALTPTGTVEALDPTSLQVEATLTSSVDPDLGIAMRPELDVMYVTATGPGGSPAVWAVSISDCRGKPVTVEQDAELPSVSPDGGFLGFVTLDTQGRQTGVAIVRLGPRGVPAGPARRYAATTTPPALPISGLAVGRDDAVLAVWGGFVDPYLGSKRVTTGTLDPTTATSLAALTPVFDERGISVPVIPGRATNWKPEGWQSSPVYLSNGELLVGDGSQQISLPFTDTTPGVSGGGIRLIVRNTGSISSLAAGPDGSLVFVGSNGKLTMAIKAADLPFGPGASTPPAAPPAERTAPGTFTAVAWTDGPAAETTPLPKVFHIIEHLPNVVGLSLPAATIVLKNLELPVFVGKTIVDPTVPSNTVLAQDPASGTGVACQCIVALTVSSQN